MNLKSFIIASIIIHIIGGIFLYFYYNPIHLSPESVPVSENQKKKKTINEKIRESFGKKESPMVPIKEKLSPEDKEHFLSKNQFKRETKKRQKKKISKASLKKREKNLNKKSEKKEEESAPLLLKELEIEARPFEEENSNLKETPEEDSGDSPPEKLNLEDMEEIPEEENPDLKTSLKTDPDLEEEAFEEEPRLPETSSEKVWSREDREEIPEKTIKEEKAVETGSSAKIKNLVSPLQKKPKSSPQRFQNLKQKKGNPSLFYPLFARRAKMQGTVSVLFFVDQQGLVNKIQLEKSSGHNELDNFVIRTLARYEFLPNQESWVRHRIPFLLEGEEVERWEFGKEQKE